MGGKKRTLPENPGPDYRYSIGDVSEITKVPIPLIRQWEERFPQLKPHRTHADRRYYLKGDIDIVLRIKTLLKHEGMTGRGASRRLSHEIAVYGKPARRLSHRELLDKIAEEAEAILRILAPDPDSIEEEEPPEPENIEHLFPRGGFKRD